MYIQKQKENFKMATWLEIIPNRNKLYVEGPQSQVEKVNNLLAKIKLENQNSDFSSK